MQRTQSYTYPYQSASNSARYSSTQGTSSAFSASANANEDWTKISDLAERRRIQNRIAQRNYRMCFCHQTATRSRIDMSPQARSSRDVLRTSSAELLLPLLPQSNRMRNLSSPTMTCRRTTVPKDAPMSPPLAQSNTGTSPQSSLPAR